MNGCSNLAPPTSLAVFQNGARKAICYALASSSSRVINAIILLKSSSYICHAHSYDCNDFGLTQLSAPHTHTHPSFCVTCKYNCVIKLSCVAKSLILDQLLYAFTTQLQSRLGKLRHSCHDGATVSPLYLLYT